MTADAPRAAWRPTATRQTLQQRATIWRLVQDFLAAPGPAR